MVLDSTEQRTNPIQSNPVQLINSLLCVCGRVVVYIIIDVTWLIKNFLFGVC